MTDPALDDIVRRAASEHRMVRDDVLTADVPALVAALRDARAVVDRLRETMALAESVFMAEARASGQYEAERDDWRRRYEALRDGVTGLHFRDARGGCASCIDPDGFSARWPCETAAVVARVEGDES